MNLPQLNMARWGSSWVLHTLCWSAVHCGWGQPLFALGLPMLVWSPNDSLSLREDPGSNVKKSLVSTTSWINMQVQNLNGDCRTNIDNVGNVFHCGFHKWANIISLKVHRKESMQTILSHLGTTEPCTAIWKKVLTGGDVSSTGSSTLWGSTKNRPHLGLSHVIQFME